MIVVEKAEFAQSYMLHPKIAFLSSICIDRNPSGFLSTTEPLFSKGDEGSIDFVPLRGITKVSVEGKGALLPLTYIAHGLTLFKTDLLRQDSALCIAKKSQAE
jgi:hypothetical protein